VRAAEKSTAQPRNAHTGLGTFSKIVLNSLTFEAAIVCRDSAQGKVEMCDDGVAAEVCPSKFTN
jgi:hypothetical protein